LSDFDRDFRVEKMRSGNPEVYLLKEEFQSLLTTPRRVDLCDWIARCFVNLEQFAEAGHWYQTAGQLILSEPTTPTVVKALAAVPEFERALECYEMSTDADTVEECSTMLAELRKACASA